MSRRKGAEGSVRKVTGGSGTWQAGLPHRLDPHRRPVPGVFRMEAAAWRALVRRTQKEVDAGTGLLLSDLDDRYWRQEPPKAGMTATVPLPRPLWRRLVALAGQRLREPPRPVPAGRLLFSRPTYPPGHTQSIGVLDNTNFRRDVWIPAREAAGLTGDESLPALDPRRYPMKVKDLRAFAASVLPRLGMEESNVIDLDIRRATGKASVTHEYL